MVSIATLADELAVSPADIRAMLAQLHGRLPVAAIVPGLLTDAQADDVRAVLDPDGVRAA